MGKNDDIAAFLLLLVRSTARLDRRSPDWSRAAANKKRALGPFSFDVQSA